MEHFSEIDTSQHRSEVYQGLQVERQSAPVVRRIIAYIIDLGIIYALIYLGMAVVFFIALGAIGGGAAIDSFTSIFSDEGTGGFLAKAGIIIVATLTILSVFGLYHGYFIYFEFKKGATPGKRFFGLSVISTEGAKLRLSQCVLRDFLRYIDCMLIFPGLISIAATKQRQRLGDLAAGTSVVYSARKERRREFLYITQEEYQYLVDVLKPQSVPPSECEAFLSFAYSRFIRKRVEEHSEESEREWEQFAFQYVPEAKERKLNLQSVLLFFAEHCYQSLHSSTGE